MHWRRSYICAARSRWQRHSYIDATFWAVAFFNCAGCSFLAAAPMRLPQQRSSPVTLIYPSMSAARIGGSTIHPCNIIGHSHVHAASTARLPHIAKLILYIVTTATMAHMPFLWLLVLATAPIHSCSTVGLQHSSSRDGCSYRTIPYSAALICAAFRL